MPRCEVKHTLIVGPQGSGKTRKAIELAKAAGTYIHCEIEAVNTGLYNILKRKPAAVIVEGSPSNLRLRSLIQNRGPIKLKSRDGTVTLFDRPQFIFCCTPANLHVIKCPNHFNVIVL